MELSVYKIGSTWHFRYGGHHETGFATKDEAQMMGEKYAVDQQKAEAKKAAKRKAKAKETSKED